MNIGGNVFLKIKASHCICVLRLKGILTSIVNRSQWQYPGCFKYCWILEQTLYRLL